MRFLLAAALALPTSLTAAGDGDTPPKIPTFFCSDGKVYDAELGQCVNPQQSNLGTDSLYQTVRQLAYTGRYVDAQKVLAAMPQDDDRTLTYLGFTNRKLGKADLGMVFYQKAIAQNSGNILARSYMGQGLVEQGDIAAAMEQLREIRAQGGAGTWPYAALRTAIATGKTYSY